MTKAFPVEFRGDKVPMFFGGDQAGSRTRNEMRILHDDARAALLLAKCLRNLLDKLPGCKEEILVLCIGTDRSTGDALGPLVGQRLLRSKLKGAAILGTLDYPVHASNLLDTLNMIERCHRGAPVIAIDACLGQSENVGTIAVGLGALRPGAGVNKNLPAVGDMFITGTVNVGGMMEYLVLQNTRLSLVMRMAETIAAGVEIAVAGEAVSERLGDPPPLALPPASGQMRQ